LLTWVNLRWFRCQTADGTFHSAVVEVDTIGRTSDPESNVYVPEWFVEEGDVRLASWLRRAGFSPTLANLTVTDAALGPAVGIEIVAEGLRYVVTPGPETKPTQMGMDMAARLHSRNATARFWIDPTPVTLEGRGAGRLEAAGGALGRLTQGGQVPPAWFQELYATRNTFELELSAERETLPNQVSDRSHLAGPRPLQGGLGSID
jgi:hypothetical protein